MAARVGFWRRMAADTVRLFAPPWQALRSLAVRRFWLGPAGALAVLVLSEVARTQAGHAFLQRWAVMRGDEPWWLTLEKVPLIGPPIGLPAGYAHLPDAGPSVAVLAVAVFLAVRLRVLWLSSLLLAYHLTEWFLIRGIAQREHLVGAAVGALLALVAARLSHRLRAVDRLPQDVRVPGVLRGLRDDVQQHPAYRPTLPRLEPGRLRERV